jgi:hypothetical protein
MTTANKFFVLTKSLFFNRLDHFRGRKQNVYQSETVYLTKKNENIIRLTTELQKCEHKNI